MYDERGKKFIDFWKGDIKALTNDVVECIFLIGKKQYPKSGRMLEVTNTPWICKFDGEKLVILFKETKHFLGNNYKVMKEVPYSKISNEAIKYMEVNYTKILPENRKDFFDRNIIIKP